MGFDTHDLFGVNLLHEVEVGTWKNVIMYLLRVLVAEGGDLVTEFDKQCISFHSFNYFTYISI